MPACASARTSPRPTRYRYHNRYRKNSSSVRKGADRGPICETDRVRYRIGWFVCDSDSDSDCDCEKNREDGGCNQAGAAGTGSAR